MNSIIVAVKYPGKPAERAVIKNDLQTMQGILGGYLEHVLMPNGMSMLVNEEGKLMGLPVNLRLPMDYILGPVIVTKGAGPEGDLVSLSEPEVAEAVLLLDGWAA